MNHFLVLLFFLLGGIWCDHRLSPGENMNLKSYCGTKPYHPRRFESRSIADGQPIKGKEAPWAALIQYPNNWCSATIISPRHVMSASHCLMSNKAKYDDVLNRMSRECSGIDLIFHPGSNELAVKNSHGKLLSDKVSKIIMMNYCLHPGFLYDDMMIWELSENIQFDDYAFPACISNNPNMQAINTVARITSYGHNNSDIQNTDSRGTYMLRTGVFQVTDYYNTVWLAINGKNWGVDARPGDSGGSVIHYNNGQYYVIGVVSHGLGLFMSGVSSVFGHFNQICSHTGIC